MTTRSPAQKYLDMRAKNLEFFQVSYPGIYQHFVNYQMQHAKVDILPQNNEIDIILDGKQRYNGRSTEYAKREVATFLSAYDYGSKIKSFMPLARDAYKNQRFFAQSIARVYDAFYERSVVFSGYELDSFFPLVTFMGVGLGKHIDILCKIRDIQHVLVFESDLDQFAASLYSVDWASIAGPFLAEPARSFTFVLVPGNATEAQKYASLWNHLIKFCPMFPATTLFYNHLGNAQHDRITEKVNSDLYVQLFSFGNLDDELNQLNNALHNFRNKTPRLRTSKLDAGDLPVCVVGSGPSLDRRIDDLKLIQDKVIIISCGTALRALWSHGIVPDIQVELESDYNTFATQRLMEDKAYMKSVRLVGAAQLNPLMFDLFGESRLFFKDDGPLAHWFGESEDVIANATPTCTNAALALVFKIGFKQVYLFGLDYGFPDVGQHHAGGSIYYNKEVKDNYKVDTKDLIIVPSSSGGHVQTTSFLYTSKRRIENLLYTKGDASVFNCSDGAKLEHAEWLANGCVYENLVSISHSKESMLSSLFGVNDKVVSAKQIDGFSRNVEQSFRTMLNLFRDWLKVTPLTDKKSMTIFCSRVAALFSEMEQNDKAFYFFIRGSVWHFLLAGYTHVYLMPPESISSYMKTWQKQFLLCMDMAETRYLEILSNESDSVDDYMIHQSISRALVSEIYWNYCGYSVQKEEIVPDDIEFEFSGYIFKDNKYSPV
jgi:hypothetical protein